MATPVTHSNPLVPVTLVTGLPCSGKSTLIRRIVGHQHAERIVWIAKTFANEDGSADSALRVLHPEEHLVEIEDPDLRCTVRGDLMQVVRELQARRAAGTLKYHRIVIETSGLTDPAPAVQAFFVDETLRDQYRLDAVVTVLDARHAMAQLDAHREAQDQVGFADRIVLTRLKQVADDDLSALYRRLKRMNPRAIVLSRDGDDEAVSQLLDVRGFALTGILDIDETGGDNAPAARDGEVTSFVFRTQRVFDKRRVEDFFTSILQVYGSRLMRYKGVVSVTGAETPVVIQGVHRLMGTDADDDWKKADPRDNRILFIGRKMPQQVIVGGLEDCLVPAGTAADKLRPAAQRKGSITNPPFKRVA